MASTSPTRDAEASKKKKISAEELEKLTTRIYDESVKHKKQNLERLQQKVYKEEPPKQIPASQIEASVTRQVNDEMERRKTRAQQLQEKFYKEAPPQKMSQMDVEESVRRIYADAMKRKQDAQRKGEEKYAFKRKPTRPLTADQVKGLGNRLCKPSKRAFTDDEINRILGFK